MTEGAAVNTLIDTDDLTPFADIDEAKAQAMIDDAVAMATMVAPCITGDTFPAAGAVKAILRGAILRWNEAGSGAVQTQSAGPFSQTLDNRQTRKGMFWPSEIEQLQQLCKTTSRAAFTIDPSAGLPVSGHLPWCSLMFGATYCSCGADINLGEPLYENATVLDNGG